MKLYPRVGVAVFVMHENKILMGKRKNAHGAATWACPGGHLEFQETLEACARREVLEETNLAIHNIRPLTFTNDIFAVEGKHYITIFMIADYASGTLTLMEPNKCDEWSWFAWQELPQPLFLPIQNLQASGFDFEKIL